MANGQDDPQEKPAWESYLDSVAPEPGGGGPAPAPAGPPPPADGDQERPEWESYLDSVAPDTTAADTATVEPEEEEGGGVVEKMGRFKDWAGEKLSGFGDWAEQAAADVGSETIKTLDAVGDYFSTRDRPRVRRLPTEPVVPEEPKGPTPAEGERPSVDDSELPAGIRAPDVAPIPLEEREPPGELPEYRSESVVETGPSTPTAPIEQAMERLREGEDPFGEGVVSGELPPYRRSDSSQTDFIERVAEAHPNPAVRLVFGNRYGASAMEGIHSGMTMTGDAFGESLETIGEYADEPEISQIGESISGWAEGQREAATDIVGRPKRFVEIESVDDAIQWAARATGEGVATSATIMGGGAVGAMVGGAPGAVAGAAIPAYMLSHGEIRSRLEEAGLEGERLRNWSTVGAVPLAALEMAMETGEILAPSAGVRREIYDGVADRVMDMARGYARAGMREGVTETMQEGAQILEVGLATGKAPPMRQVAAQLGEAAPAGFVGGGPFGATMQMAEGQRRHLLETGRRNRRHLALTLREARRRGAEWLSPELAEEATTDPLTGLANRTGEQRARDEREAPENTERVVLVGDIDNMKGVNDELGHAEGDRAIQIVGEVLHEETREDDTVVTVARPGGDEFRVTLDVPEGTSPHAYRHRIEEAVNQRLQEEYGDQLEGEVGFSLGLGDEGMYARKEERGVSQPREDERPDLGEIQWEDVSTEELRNQYSDEELRDLLVQAEEQMYPSAWEQVRTALGGNVARSTQEELLLSETESYLQARLATDNLSEMETTRVRGHLDAAGRNDEALRPSVVAHLVELHERGEDVVGQLRKIDESYDRNWEGQLRRQYGQLYEEMFGDEAQATPVEVEQASPLNTINVKVPLEEIGTPELRQMRENVTRRKEEGWREDVETIRTELDRRGELEPDPPQATEPIDEGPAEGRERVEEMAGEVPLGETLATDGAHLGRETTVKAPDGTRLRARYRWVSLDELIGSHNPESFNVNPAYPEGVQDRRYEADEQARQRVFDIEANFDPEEYHDLTIQAAAGPSVVLPDGKIISGFNRYAALHRVFQNRPGLREEVIADQERVAGQMGLGERPSDDAVIVRELPVEALQEAGFDPTNRDHLAALSSRFNDPISKARDTLGDARVRAKRLEQAPDALNFFLDHIDADQTLRSFLATAKGRDFVQALVRQGIITQNEAGEFFDANGNITEQAKVFVEQMVHATVITDPDLLARAPDQTVRYLEKSMPAIVQAAQVEGYDVRTEVMQALDILSRFQQGDFKDLETFLSQRSLLEEDQDPLATKMARFLHARAGGTYYVVDGALYKEDEVRAELAEDPRFKGGEENVQEVLESLDTETLTAPQEMRRAFTLFAMDAQKAQEAMQARQETAGDLFGEPPPLPDPAEKFWRRFVNRDYREPETEIPMKGRGEPEAEPAPAPEPEPTDETVAKLQRLMEENTRSELQGEYGRRLTSQPQNVRFLALHARNQLLATVMGAETAQDPAWNLRVSGSDLVAALQAAQDLPSLTTMQREAIEEAFTALRMAEEATGSTFTTREGEPSLDELTEGVPEEQGLHTQDGPYEEMLLTAVSSAERPVRQAEIMVEYLDLTQQVVDEGNISVDPVTGEISDSRVERMDELQGELAEPVRNAVVRLRDLVDEGELTAEQRGQIYRNVRNKLQDRMLGFDEEGGGPVMDAEYQPSLGEEPMPGDLETRANVNLDEMSLGELRSLSDSLERRLRTYREREALGQDPPWSADQQALIRSDVSAIDDAIWSRITERQVEDGEATPSMVRRYREINGQFPEELQGPAEQIMEDAEDSYRPDGPPSMHQVGQGDLFGTASPAEGGDQFKLFGDGDAFEKQGLSEAEAAAAETLRELSGRELDAMTDEEQARLDDAIRLLRRSEKFTADEVRQMIRAGRWQGFAERQDQEPGQGELFSEVTTPEHWGERGAIIGRFIESLKDLPMGGVEQQDAGPFHQEPPDADPMEDFPEGFEDKNMPTREEIVAALAEVLKVPIRSGKFRFRSPGHLGVYKVIPEAIRTQWANDIETTAHEVGHHVHKLIFGEEGLTEGGFLSKKALAPWKSELEPLAEGISDESVLEGEAEFFRLFITNPDVARDRAPEFFEFVVSQLGQHEPGVLEALRSAREKYQTFRAGTAEQRVHSLFRNVGDPSTINLSPRKLLESAYRTVVDQFFPAKKYRREFFESADDTPIGKLMDGYLRLTRASASMAEHWLYKGQVRYDPDSGDRQRVGPSLAEILAPVEEDLELFTVWAASARALERKQRGFRETGIRDEDASEIFHRYKDREGFVEALEGIQRFRENQLRYLVDTGVLTEDTVERILEHSTLYMPFHRAMESELLKGGAGAAGASVQVTSPIKRFKGSSAPMVHPIDSLIQDTFAFMNAAYRQEAANALFELSKERGAAWFAENVAKPVEVTNVQPLEVLEDMTRDLARKHEQGAISEELFEQWLGTLEDLAEEAPEVLLEMVQVFRPGDYWGNRNVVGVIQNGNRYWFEINEEVEGLYDALTDREFGQAEGLLKLLFPRTPARVLRFGATAAPIFSLARNPQRDILTSYIQSEYGITPFVDHLAGFFHLAQKGDWYWRFKRGGGEFAALIDEDRETLSQAIRRWQEGRHIPGVVNNWKSGLRNFSAMVENVSRMAEFKRAYDHWKDHGVSDREAEIRAGLAAREVVVDFARHGAGTAAIRGGIAFWNAALQGWDKMIRQFKENPGRTTLRAIKSVTLPTALLFGINADNPDYWETPQWVRSWFWLVPIPDWVVESADFVTPDALSNLLTNEQGEGVMSEVASPAVKRGDTYFIRFAKPHVYGWVFGTIPELAAEAALEDDPQGLKKGLSEFARRTALEFTPLATAYEPIVEGMLNYDFFMQRQIVPRNLEEVEPRKQYTIYTSPTARMISDEVYELSGENVQLSPIKLENMVQDYTGSLGRDALNLADRFLDAVADPAGYAPPAGTRFPIVGGAFQAAYEVQPESVHRFYERYREMRQKKATLDRMQEEMLSGETAQVEEMQRYIEENTREIAFVTEFRAVSEELRRLHKLRQTLAFTDAPDELQRKAVARNYRLAARLARAALQRELPSGAADELIEDYVPRRLRR